MADIEAIKIVLLPGRPRCVPSRFPKYIDPIYDFNTYLDFRLILGLWMSAFHAMRSKQHVNELNLLQGFAEGTFKHREAIDLPTETLKCETHPVPHISSPNDDT